ncbi:energy-coupled thiamine transporter ThiT [Facklamia miroungae]|uniref:Thiamine transporter n=1 Tax=Facklamia miroungae TaxID=120956 RepID=A0A1G7SWU2_9LACT|nr:energy-coupled thiamine transporter ThiT [Facklamia miroungae]NKZ29524.1 energy-coupled thiamine transporter ThiT [Facklamia miroungae]SDG26899.1 thiamine transporter [Facklamia miroungae]
MGKNKNVLLLVEAAIFAAVAVVLSLLPTNFGSSLTISLGMVPLTILSLKRGVKWGIFCGFLWGLLHFPLGNVYFLGVSQVFIEYVIAFAFAGFAGLMSERFYHSTNKVWPLISAVFIGTFARFFWHFIAGYIYWGSYAPEGWSPLYFSFVMNGASALMTAIVSAIILFLIYQTAPRLFQRKNS